MIYVNKVFTMQGISDDAITNLRELISDIAKEARLRRCLRQRIIVLVRAHR